MNPDSHATVPIDDWANSSWNSGARGTASTQSTSGEDRPTMDAADIATALSGQQSGATAGRHPSPLTTGAVSLNEQRMETDQPTVQPPVQHVAQQPVQLAAQLPSQPGGQLSIGNGSTPRIRSASPNAQQNGSQSQRSPIVEDPDGYDMLEDRHEPHDNFYRNAVPPSLHAPTGNRFVSSRSVPHSDQHMSSSLAHNVPHGYSPAAMIPTSSFGYPATAYHPYFNTSAGPYLVHHPFGLPSPGAYDPPSFSYTPPLGSSRPTEPRRQPPAIHGATYQERRRNAFQLTGQQPPAPTSAIVRHGQNSATPSGSTAAARSLLNNLQLVKSSSTLTCMSAIDTVRTILFKDQTIVFYYKSGQRNFYATEPELLEGLRSSKGAAFFALRSSVRSPPLVNPAAEEAWARFLSDSTIMTISGYWTRQSLLTYMACMPNVKELYLIDIEVPDLLLVNLASVFPRFIERITIDCRKFQNSIYMSNLKQIIEMFRNRNHKPQCIVLLVTDFPRSSAFDDYFLKAHEFVTEQIMILVDAPPDDRYLSTLAFHRISLYSIITWESPNDEYMIFQRDVNNIFFSVGFRLPDDLKGSSR